MMMVLAFTVRKFTLNRLSCLVHFFLPLIVRSLCYIVVFIRAETLQKVCKREQCPCLERVRANSVLLTACRWVTDAKVRLFFELFVDLEESVDCFALFIFVVHKAALDQKLEKTREILATLIAGAGARTCDNSAAATAHVN